MAYDTKEDKDAEHLILCTPVDHKKYAPHLDYIPEPGSVKVPCLECGQMMYLGPRSKKLMETKHVRAMCMICGIARINSDEIPDEEVKIVNLKEEEQKANADKR